MYSIRLDGYAKKMKRRVRQKNAGAHLHTHPCTRFRQTYWLEFVITATGDVFFVFAPQDVTFGRFQDA